jgi:hypothetical protein
MNNARVIKPYVRDIMVCLKSEPSTSKWIMFVELKSQLKCFFRIQNRKIECKVNERRMPGEERGP